MSTAATDQLGNIPLPASSTEILGTLEPSVHTSKASKYTREYIEAKKKAAHYKKLYIKTKEIKYETKHKIYSAKAYQLRKYLNKYSTTASGPFSAVRGLDRNGNGIVNPHIDARTRTDILKITKELMEAKKKAAYYKGLYTKNKDQKYYLKYKMYTKKAQKIQLYLMKYATPPIPANAPRGTSGITGDNEDNFSRQGSPVDRAAHLRQEYMNARRRGDTRRAQIYFRRYQLYKRTSSREGPTSETLGSEIDDSEDRFRAPTRRDDRFGRMDAPVNKVSHYLQKYLRAKRSGNARMAEMYLRKYNSYSTNNIPDEQFDPTSGDISSGGPSRGEEDFGANSNNGNSGFDSSGRPIRATLDRRSIAGDGRSTKVIRLTREYKDAMRKATDYKKIYVQTKDRKYFRKYQKYGTKARQIKVYLQKYGDPTNRKPVSKAVHAGQKYLNARQRGDTPTADEYLRKYKLYSTTNTRGLPPSLPRGNGLFGNMGVDRFGSPITSTLESNIFAGQFPGRFPGRLFGRTYPYGRYSYGGRPLGSRRAPFGAGLGRSPIVPFSQEEAYYPY